MAATADDAKPAAPTCRAARLPHPAQPRLKGGAAQ
jgi:hypothetical protein